MTDDKLQQALQRAYDNHRETVHGLCYRMTGSESDAEDLTQQTFVRLRERPPEDLDSSLRGWVLQVAANLSRDYLRKRKRVDYVGPWLPAPVELDESTGWFAREHRSPRETDPEERYGQLESVSYGFLVALEALTPNQRSVLLLRDVYGMSIREAAEALELSESNVKVTHHRARKALPEDVDRLPTPDDELADKTGALLQELMQALVEEDADRLRELFADDIRLVSDGGEYASATRPIEGIADTSAFLEGLQQNGPTPDAIETTEVNGLPALIVEFDDPPPRQAPRVVVRADLDANDQIAQLHFVMAPEKIGHIH